MIAALNKRWLSMGWRVMDKSDSEPMALVFIERLGDIPYQHYDELATRAGQLRSQRLAQGLSCDDFSADLMLACWPALRQELLAREVAQGRTLTASAETQCRRCFGTMMEQIFDEEGRFLGVRAGCKHEILEETPCEDDLDAVIKIAHFFAQETAAEICQRLMVELTREWVATAPESADAHQLWQTIGYLGRVRKHCQECEGDQL